MKDEGNYTDENWDAELAEATSKLGIKQKRALIAYYNYHKKMEVVMRKFLAGDIKNIENALLLLDCYLTDVLQKTVHTPGAMDGLAINYEQICGLQNYYINIIKNAAERNTQTPKEKIPAPNTIKQEPIITPTAEKLRKKFKGIVVSDLGINKLDSLEEAAEKIYETEKIAWTLLQKVVLKPDGSFYSESSCRKAIEMVQAKNNS